MERPPVVTGMVDWRTRGIMAMDSQSLLLECKRQRLQGVEDEEDE